MKKSFALKSALLLLTSTLLPQTIYAGDEADKILKATRHGEKGGNGGGLITRNGEVVTIGSSQTQLIVSKLSAHDVVGLDWLALAVDSLKLDPKTKANVLKSIVPSGERAYFRIREEGVSHEKLAELRAVYADLVSAHGADISIAAVTIGKETYLLPDFFKLKKVEQAAAILWHECLWVMNPNAEYAKVVQSEVHMQDYLERGMPGFSLNLYESIEMAMKTSMEFKMAVFRSAVDYDKRVLGITHTIGDLLGEEVLKNRESADNDSQAERPSAPTTFFNFLRDEHSELRSSFEASLGERVILKPASAVYPTVLRYLPFLKADIAYICEINDFLSEVETWATRVTFNRGEVAYRRSDIAGTKLDAAQLLAKKVSTQIGVFGSDLIVSAASVASPLNSERQSGTLLLESNRKEMNAIYYFNGLLQDTYRPRQCGLYVTLEFNNY